MNGYKTTRIIKGILIGSILTVLTLIALAVWFLRLAFFGPPADKSTSIKDYQDIFEFPIHRSGLLIFPEEIRESMTDIEFSYYFRDTWNTPTVSIFLQGTYSPQDYEAELARLENIRKVYGGTTRTLLRDEEGKYPYPAYIAVEDHLSQYEYALLTGENQITYIYTAYFNKDEVPFDTKYLPVDYWKEEGKSSGGYSIYLERQDEASGITTYDTTRDEYVTVSYYHIEQIEDSFFMVKVTLDDQNREIIEECELSPQNIVFDDLKGYEWKDLKLSADRTAAIVIYLDQEEEKEWQVDLIPYM